MAEWKKVVLDGAAASLASLTLTTDLPVSSGGTGASTEAAARTNLGLAIGSDVQAYDAGLAAIAGLATTDGGFIVGNGSTFVLETGATVRTSLGLGTVATRDTGIGENNIPIFEAGAADDDFLRINGSTIEGRSASEVRGDISAAARGANSDITSLSGLTTALSVAQGGTGLDSLGTAGSDILSLARGSATQVLRVNSAGDGLEFAAVAGDIAGVETAANSGLAGGANTGTPSLSLDVNNLTAADIDVAADFIAFSDEGTAGDPTRKESVADLVSAVAGTVTSTGLAASSGVLSLDIANLNAGGPPLGQNDEFVYSDGGTLEKVSFSNLEDSIFNNITGDISIAAGGAVTIGANTIEGGAGGGMLNDNVINSQTAISGDVADNDELLIYDLSATRIRKASISAVVAQAPQGTVTSVAGGTGLTSTGGTTPSLSVDAAQTGITSLTGVNSINSGGNALALGSTDSAVTVNGNLIVKGTASFEDAETLRVKDPMIILGSGSSGAQDGGFIVEQSGGETGQFFGYDSGAGASGGRFGVAAGIDESATAVSLQNFISTVSMSAGTPVDTTPLYGGNQGYGAFAVDTSNYDVYVYMPSA